MPQNKRIRLIGKRAVFNAEAWARAVEALSRQLQREAQTASSAAASASPATQPDSSS